MKEGAKERGIAKKEGREEMVPMLWKRTELSVSVLSQSMEVHVKLFKISR